MLRQDPQHIQQHGSQYAQEAAADATSWMAEHIPPEWQLQPKYAMLPDDAGVVMANGVTKAQQRFQKYLERLVVIFLKGDGFSIHQVKYIIPFFLDFPAPTTYSLSG